MRSAGWREAGENQREGEADETTASVYRGGIRIHMHFMFTALLFNFDLCIVEDKSGLFVLHVEEEPRYCT